MTLDPPAPCIRLAAAAPTAPAVCRPNQELDLSGSCLAAAAAAAPMHLLLLLLLHCWLAAMLLLRRKCCSLHAAVVASHASLQISSPSWRQGIPAERGNST
jgi:hypothetical protein